MLIFIYKYRRMRVNVPIYSAFSVLFSCLIDIFQYMYTSIFTYHVCVVLLVTIAYEREKTIL